MPVPQEQLGPRVLKVKPVLWALQDKGVSTDKRVKLDKLDKLDPGKYSNAFLSGQVTAAFETLDEKLNKLWLVEAKLDDAQADRKATQNLLCKVAGNLQRVEAKVDKILAMVKFDQVLFARILVEVKKGTREVLKINAQGMGRPPLAVHEEAPEAEAAAAAHQPGGAEGAQAPAGEVEDPGEAPADRAGGDEY